MSKKVETIDFRSFIRNEYQEQNLNGLKTIRLGATIFAIMIPQTTFAATADATFNNIWPAVMNIVDWIAVGVFTFSGVSWMFGHRSKSLEFLIGGAAGYILARHAVDLRNFLKTL